MIVVATIGLVRNIAGISERRYSHSSSSSDPNHQIRYVSAPSRSSDLERYVEQKERIGNIGEHHDDRFLSFERCPLSSVVHRPNRRTGGLVLVFLPLFEDPHSPPPPPHRVFVFSFIVPSSFVLRKQRGSGTSNPSFCSHSFGPFFLVSSPSSIISTVLLFRRSKRGEGGSFPSTVRNTTLPFGRRTIVPVVVCGPSSFDRTIIVHCTPCCLYFYY